MSSHPPSPPATTTASEARDEGPGSMVTAAAPSVLGSDIVAALRAELGDCVHLPASEGYRASLAAVFFPDALPDPGTDRGWFYGKSVFTGLTLGAIVADGLAEAIRCAPTRMCRIDFQHTGGALADIADAAFWGRRGEWNIPLNAIWPEAQDGAAWYAWARQTLGVLAGDTKGVYSVEVRPGFAETEREIASAFGANLPRLRTLRRQHDPAGVLAGYPL